MIAHQKHTACCIGGIALELITMSSVAVATLQLITISSVAVVCSRGFKTIQLKLWLELPQIFCGNRHGLCDIHCHLLLLC